MKRVLGLIVLLLALIGGVYIGGWICFCKAIVDMIGAIMAGVILMDIAVALFKIFILLPIIEVIAYMAFLWGFGTLISGK